MQHPQPNDRTRNAGFVRGPDVISGACGQRLCRVSIHAPTPFDGLLPVAVIRPFRGQLDRVPSIAQKFSMSLSVFRRLSNITRGLAERGAKAVVFAIVDDSHGLSDVLSFMAVSPGQDLLLQGPKEAKSLMRGVIQRAQKDQVIPTVVLSLAQSRHLMAQLGVDQVKLKMALLGEGEMPAAKTATSSKVRIDVLHDEKAMTSNVVALLRGADPVLRDEAIIFVAHMDHVGQRMDGQVFNGADDNASGVAGLLEIAGAFAMADPKPRRSVVFLSVSGEENGLWGSSYYTAHPAWPLDKTVAVINMDRIGRTGPNAKRLAVTVTPSYKHKALGHRAFKQRLGPPEPHSATIAPRTTIQQAVAASPQNLVARNPDRGAVPGTCPCRRAAAHRSLGIRFVPACHGLGSGLRAGWRKEKHQREGGAANHAVILGPYPRRKAAASSLRCSASA